MLAVLAVGAAPAPARPARMALDKEFASQVTTMAVEKRGWFFTNESFKFGPYAVTGVKREWTHRKGWGGFGYENTKARQKYEFTLGTQKEPDAWQGRCATDVDEETFRFLVGDRAEVTTQLTAESRFACTFRKGEQGKPWRLLLTRQMGEYFYNGFLADDSRTILVRGTRQLEGTPMPLMDAAGYFFDVEGKPVGAVETLNDGRVFLSPSLDETARDVLACASTALLLYQELSRK